MYVVGYEPCTYVGLGLFVRTYVSFQLCGSTGMAKGSRWIGCQIGILVGWAGRLPKHALDSGRLGQVPAPSAQVLIETGCIQKHVAQIVGPLEPPRRQVLIKAGGTGKHEQTLP